MCSVIVYVAFGQKSFETPDLQHSEKCWIRCFAL